MFFFECKEGASVTGAMSQYTETMCNPTHPTPVMEIHGTADSTVPFNSIISGLEYWRDYNNCSSTADTTVIPDLVLGDWSTVEHIIYTNGDNGVTTEWVFMKIHFTSNRKVLGLS